MNVSNYIKFLVIGWAAIMLLQCSNLTSIAGAGSETTNSLTGSLANADGSPASYTLVRLVPCNYNREKDAQLASVQTDIAGKYAFSNIDTGTYNIEAVSIALRTRSLVLGVHAVGPAVTVSEDTLVTPGAIKIILPASVDITNGYVFIPGTTISSLLIDKSGFVVLDSVPAGKMVTVSYAVKNSGVAPKQFGDSVSVPQGGIVTISYPDWIFSKKILLITSASGANVTGNVFNFPLLIRLKGPEFDFSQSAAGGADIRFTKSDGTPLPFEIETWDSSAGNAAVWVKVDTVLGNNNFQSIAMFWGNPNAASESNGPAVFDTTKGFQGVWHLSGPGDGVAADATINHYDGTSFGMTPALGVQGVIGGARSFIDSTTYITMPGTAISKLNFPQNGFYTISTWAYVDLLDTLVRTMVSKGNQQYVFQTHQSHDWRFSEYASNLNWEYTSTPATAKTWSHVVAVRAGSSQYLYVNGVCTDSAVNIMWCGKPYYSGFNLSIGKLEEMGTPVASAFKGMIDEVRISNVVRSSDWIRLCYVNQKEQDALVKFR